LVDPPTYPTIKGIIAILQGPILQQPPRKTSRYPKKKRFGAVSDRGHATDP
jgi:hypothetical protein